jgi:hypothetical protein
MSFAEDISKFATKVQTNSQAVFVNTASHVYESIVNGDQLTGAPGQPVQTGALRASWNLTFDSPTDATISTNMVYAPAIEDAVGPHGSLTLRSQVGGFHSVALTVAGMPRIVAAESAKVFK